MLTPHPPKPTSSKPFVAVAIAFAAFIAGIIALANSNSSLIQSVQAGIPYADKIGHFVLIGGMCLFANLALQNRRLHLLGRDWLVGSLVVLVVFTVEEFMQLGLTHRTFDLGDLSADFVGIFVFGRIARWLGQRFNWV